MRSELVVISWWSNCLGLTCLHRLAQHTGNRRIYVVQVGKTEAQKQRFRRYLPASVQELPYAPDRPAEHGKVIEAIAHDLLPGREGLWFIDHDFFALEPLEPWLVDMDREFQGTQYCLCHPEPDGGLSITCPAFWLSPQRFPEAIPGFEPLPYRPMQSSQRPDRFRAPADLVVPQKDTLVLAQEFFAERGLVCGYPSESLPGHDHLGGLYLFANEILPPSFLDWMARCVERFTAFYAACPRAWVGAEDPVLLQRLEEFRRAVHHPRVGSSQADDEMMSRALTGRAGVH